jgi:acetylornithine deacetylase
LYHFSFAVPCLLAIKKSGSLATSVSTTLYPTSQMPTNTHSLPELTRMIGQLIATPSVSSVSPTYDQGNMDVINLLADWCETAGFQVEVMPVGNNKANLIATLGKGDGGLVLSGHTDTVPYDDSHWNSDPFIATEKDNRIYGLGTADMKSFLAIALYAIQGIDPGKLIAPLILLATADEESSMSGAKALVQAGRPANRHAIIGEPTNMRPVRMHKGIFMEAIHLQGRSGHSSDPSLGNSALEGMHRIIQVLTEWRSELQARHHNEAFAVPVPTLNLGHIHGGDNPNRICANCELHIDLRPLPGMSIDELRAELEHRIAIAISDNDLKLTTRQLFSGIPAMETPAEASLVKTAERLTGYKAQAVAYGTEAPYLQQLGNEVIVLGPGSIDQAHQPDEFLSTAQINPMLDILTKFINHYCTAH